MKFNALVLGEINDRMLGSNEWSQALGQISSRRCASVDEAIGLLSAEHFDCVLLVDSGATGQTSDLIETIQSLNTKVPVIVASARLSAAEAVRLSRTGAWNCFGPGDTLDNFRDSLDYAAEETRRRRRNENTGGQAEAWRVFLIGDSLAMETVAETIRLVGPRRCTVLISGETGTGKEMAARAIHMASPRAAQNMVSVNCSALPENLLEAELFGHTRGAFTGAAGHRVGRFEQAHKGTIFLDEIGDLPLELQAKLLRVLQERELQRLGSSETIKVDVRVIAATNVDIAEKIRLGKFREDLYYRLNVVPLKMPPLRNRVTDVPSLVAHFVKKICQSEDIPVKRIAPESLQHLAASPWPGNVRQLENAIEMAVAISGERDVLFPKDFGFNGTKIANIPVPALPLEMPEAEGFDNAVSRFELGILENALRASGGNKTVAAERLGMKRTTLIMKIRNLQQSGFLSKAG
ncbi:MAG TPA: sigma-54 dependent transcriptional regulator [Bryobacteraceae bacterium]|jgi:DNA-binding NtrC family response regulator|nr:sigma-54 dependent transcriptional regulator [Bryobacteraceae bacterium]